MKVPKLIVPREQISATLRGRGFGPLGKAVRRGA